MHIHEYQAKEIFGQYGIQTPRSVLINNLSEAEQTTFNNMVDGGDVEQAKFAVQGLMMKSGTNFNPNQPKLFEGTSDIVSADAFTSVSQVTDAMNDPRYEKDPSFRKEVENKLSRSKVI